MHVLGRRFLAKPMVEIEVAKADTAWSLLERHWYRLATLDLPGASL